MLPKLKKFGKHWANATKNDNRYGQAEGGGWGVILIRILIGNVTKKLFVFERGKESRFLFVTAKNTIF